MLTQIATTTVYKIVNDGAWTSVTNEAEDIKWIKSLKIYHKHKQHKR